MKRLVEGRWVDLPVITDIVERDVGRMVRAIQKVVKVLLRIRLIFCARRLHENVREHQAVVLQAEVGVVPLQLLNHPVVEPSVGTHLHRSIVAILRPETKVDLVQDLPWSTSGKH